MVRIEPTQEIPWTPRDLWFFSTVLRGLALLQTLTQRAQIRGRNLHALVRTRDRIKHTLALQVDLPGAAGMTHRVTASVAK